MRGRIKFVTSPRIILNTYNYNKLNKFNLFLPNFSKVILVNPNGSKNGFLNPLTRKLWRFGNISAAFGTDPIVNRYLTDKFLVLSLVFLETKICSLGKSSCVLKMSFSIKYFTFKLIKSGWRRLNEIHLNKFLSSIYNSFILIFC